MKGLFNYRKAIFSEYFLIITEYVSPEFLYCSSILYLPILNLYLSTDWGTMRGKVYIDEKADDSQTLGRNSFIKICVKYQ